MKHTYLDKQLVGSGNGDFYEWWVCANDDGSILAKVWNEHLAIVIQQAIENDIEKNEQNGWE